ncbi:efflux transporter outer membrane subunit [Caulobacter sp. S45]|uniref:efflux transporter outer membrane subunit n=1 Tax=Caulobacter sp. S45 TaxID=1641861 RepID=UPI0015751D24|nr:efflux transporter outer membrane subunit [Caulobacter sp. S45]
MRRRELHPAFAALLAGAAVCACTVGPDYRRPDMAAPPAYQEIGTRKDAPLSQPAVAPVDEVQVASWWKQFNDPLLDQLVERAMAGNLDLKTEVARIRQSREQEVVAGAAGLPHVSTAANAARINTNASNSALGSLTGRSSGGAGGAAAEAAGAAAGEAPSHIDNFAVAFDATWEIDVFGGVRRSVEAARAGTQAMIWAKRDGQVSLTAEVASDYLQLRSLQAQVAIAQGEIASQQATFAIIHQQAQTGFVTRLNVNQQQAQVQATIAAIPQLEAQARGQIHALGVLVGEDPEALAPELDHLKSNDLPGVPQTLPVGLPSDLLRRRPDVREAERQLAQATATVGVQVANLYPKFNILALGALTSPTFHDVFNANSGTSAGVGLIQWPVFQGGQIRGNIRAARAQQDQAYYTYQKTVLTALQDVEDSLARYQADQRRIVAQKASVDASANSLTIARQQYEVGLVTFINVLQAEQTDLNARNGLVQDEGQLAVDLTSLYKALGGGWTADEGKLLQKAGLSSP